MGRAEPKGDRAMSRTDKTAPFRVKVLYYPKWVEEYHDHDLGLPCELPERATVDNVDQYEQLCLYKGEWVPRHSLDYKDRWYLPFRNTCHWTASREYWCSAMARCGCSHCDGDHHETTRRKRERQYVKNYVRNWHKEY